MCDTELCLFEAMERSEHCSSVELGARSPRVVKIGMKREDTRCDIHVGVTLEVSLQPKRMRHVANLIVAMQRMKNHDKLCGTEFSDHELLNIMMENIVEECVMVKLHDEVDGKTDQFTSTSRVLKCSVCDQYQKSLVLNQEPLELHAMTLQGGSFKHKVSLNLSTYMTPSVTAVKGQPVVLGIVGTNFYLSCTKQEEMAILQLEEVSNKALLKTITLQGDTGRFLFFKKSSGVSTTSFESAKFPGWYISTAMEEQQPVEMCLMQHASRLTSFMVKQM